MSITPEDHRRLLESWEKDEGFVNEIKAKLAGGGTQAAAAQFATSLQAAGAAMQQASTPPPGAFAPPQVTQQQSISTVRHDATGGPPVTANRDRRSGPPSMGC